MAFEIVDVCKRKSSAGYYFKYIDVQLVGNRDIEDTDHDYTPCGELMSAAWCRWTLDTLCWRKQKISALSCFHVIVQFFF
jgi:hypothetical protein